MHRAWMYGSRDTCEFVDGFFEFCDAALSHQAAMGTEGFYCPCVDCGNVGMASNIGSLRQHIFRRKFRQDYHSEFDVIENEKNLEDEYENIEVEDDDDDGDHIEEMMEGVDDHAGKRPRIFECMAEASQKPLYPSCTRYTKLTGMITLFNIKTKAGISYSAFTSLLQAFGDMLLDSHELPKSNYYAKKLMCPFGLEYQRIHVFPNDCVLYRNEYANMDECPRCGRSRYRRTGVGDKKGSPAKVMWYLPNIPRFKRMFSIKKDTKNLRWHAERRKNDGFLKHPANAPEWKDAHADEVFTLKPMLLYTLNYFPAYENLSGYKNKGKKAFPICIDDTKSKYISTCHKEVYMRTRRFLRRDHPYRNKKKVFYGTVEEGVAHRPLTGIEVFDQVKDIKTIFGKGAGVGGKGLWKKESILWKLSYWGV
ncbi:uncharacterized protein LOC125492837 [Beta vulgaris subsp. vulgaris]|uniref:uncharacterized protein LOC125492837 n=1 Tax=Beta vulgaris subsp. vulgaris TaxID=3555 RepID=UPI0020369418|nr:uncharacterized protein LOC125492837 [Beta vulgaris subsp. vulgaris]